MGCSACGKRSAGARRTYEARFADGTTKVYASEQEARAAVARRGGTFRRTG